MAARPNVLLLVLDTARADAFEPWGAPTGTTPAVAQLAAGGSVAPAAYAPSCWTVPSHAAMFTGLLPRTLGLGRSAGNTPQGYAETLASHRERLLATVLSGAGYATAGVSANLWVSPESGFATGFDRFRYVRSPRTAELGDTSWQGRARWALEAVRARADDGAGEVERLLGAWLAEPDDRPFFWFVNLVECHTPYLPPRPYNDLGRLDRARAGRDAQAHQSFAAMSVASLRRQAPPDDAVERMEHLYRRSVQLMDDWLARILSSLDERGVLDETLVVVTSDHGENLGECGLMGHCFSLDDRLIHVPLLASGPAAPAFDGVTSLVDMPAVLAGALDLDEHPWGSPPQRSVAVAQLDAPAGRDDPIAHQVRTDLALDDAAFERMVTPLTAATDGRFKLVDRGGDEELYDLGTDPLEERPVDLTGDHGADLDPLRAALQAAKAAEIRPDAPVVADALAADEAADLKARMELLGYL